MKADGNESQGDATARAASTPSRLASGGSRNSISDSSVIARPIARSTEYGFNSFE